MFFFRFLVVFISVTIQAHATHATELFSRTYWSPMYHGKSLAYCSCDKKKCGLPVANEYCQAMGYSKADKEKIAYNVGLANDLHGCLECKGWRCNGFSYIRCQSEMSSKPHVFNYRYRLFVYPRLENYRIDWCYANHKDCGRRAAYSFCRRMGYAQVRRFSSEAHIEATKAIGDHRLCFGPQCKGFLSILCYR